MKRLVIVSIAILGLATAGLAYAEDPGTVSPACADYTGTGGFSLTSGVVGGSLDLAAESCPNITYTLHVLYTNPSGRQFTRRQSVQGNGSPFVQFSVRVPGNLTSVETFVESANASGAILDRGPDSGTVTVTSGSPGGGAYN